MEKILRLFIGIIFTYLVHGQDECVNPVGVRGECIVIEECPKLLPLIKGSDADRERLKSMHCGFVGLSPKVCCVNTPRMSLSTDQYLSNITNESGPVTTIATEALSIKTTTPETKLPSKSSCYSLEGNQGSCVVIKECPELAKRLIRPGKGKELEYVQKNRCLEPTKYCCEKPI